MLFPRVDVKECLLRNAPMKYARKVENIEIDMTTARSAEALSQLERARSLYVLEITLEPIEGLDESNYTLNLDDTSPAGQKVVASTASRFYSEVAPSINVRDAQRILEKCGKEYAALA